MSFVGKTISGRYKIYDKIGSGGMATVYLARDLETYEVVAIKILREELEHTSTYVQRFEREAEIATKLKHKNIAQIRDFGVEDGVYYIVMEYVQGKTLEKIIEEKGRLSPEETVEIAEAVARALDFAHKHGVIAHRDIKPQNIMVARDGTVKVMDFGIAKVSDTSTLTSEGSIIGTPYYISPEQAKGKPADIRSDLYSLGVVMFQMVTGQVPFKAETPWSIINMHISSPPPKIEKLNKDVPKELRHIIYKLLRKRPRDRYQTPGELLEALSKLSASMKSTQEIAKTMVISPPEQLEATVVLPASGTEERTVVLPSSGGEEQTVVLESEPGGQAEDKTVVVPQVPGGEPSSVMGDLKSVVPQVSGTILAGKKAWMALAAGALVILLVISGVMFATRHSARPVPTHVVGSFTPGPTPGQEPTRQKIAAGTAQIVPIATLTPRRTPGPRPTRQGVSTATPRIKRITGTPMPRPTAVHEILPTPSPTTWVRPHDMKVYVHPKGLYVVQYPTEWKVDPDSDEEDLYLDSPDFPDGDFLQCAVFVDEYKGSGGSFDDEISLWVDTLSASGDVLSKGYKVIGGEKYYRIEYTEVMTNTDESGQVVSIPQKGEMYLIDVNDYAFGIDCEASPTDFKKSKPNILKLLENFVPSRKYSNEKKRFSLRYPIDWKVGTQGPAIRMDSPLFKDKFSATCFADSYLKEQSGVTFKDVIAAVRKGLNKGGTKVSSEGYVTIGENKFYHFEFGGNATDLNGNPMPVKGEEYVLGTQDAIYELQCDATPSDYAAAKPLFEMILRSFTPS